MNAFIKSLFTVLFGWIKSVIQGMWDTVFSGTYHGFFVWLSHAWPYLVVLLCILCTLVDYAVWLVRWRPYVMWKQRLRRLFRKGHDAPAAEEPAQAPAAPPLTGQPYRYFPPEQPVQRHRRSQR